MQEVTSAGRIPGIKELLSVEALNNLLLIMKGPALPTYHEEEIFPYDSKDLEELLLIRIRVSSTTRWSSRGPSSSTG